MKKKIKFILASLVLVIVLGAVLTGCAKSPNLGGGDASATTYNNNSLVVTQGNYIYFVNGKILLDDIAEKKDNEYGKVIKSAIYRAKKDGSNPEVVVPQVAMDSNNANGISVLGGYIYFTSPSTATGKDGSLQKSNTDLYRVQISGQKLEKLVTLEGNTNSYKFTDKGLIYFADSKLTYLPYGGKGKVISERASSNYFPVTDTYVPGKADPSMAVYFTESPEENDGDPYNDIKVVAADGTVKTVLSGKDAKATYSLKSVEVEADGNVAVYYEKTIYDNGNQVNKGLFGIKVNSKFEKSADEKQFANASASVRYIDYATGVYVFENSEMFIPVIDEYGYAKKGEKVYYTGSEIAKDKILQIKDGYIYYFESNGLYKVQMDVNDKGGLGISQMIIEKNINTDYVKPVLNGNILYYINTGYYNYMYQVDISVAEAKHSILGVRTENDKKAYIEYVKGLDEDARAEHDKLIKEDLSADDLKSE